MQANKQAKCGEKNYSMSKKIMYHEFSPSVGWSEQGFARFLLNVLHASDIDCCKYYCISCAS